MLKHTYAFQRKNPLLFCLLLIVVGTLLLTACGGTNVSATPVVPTPTSVAATPTATASSPIPTPVQGSLQTVKITDGSNGSFGFGPTTLTVKVGTTIIWKNVSSVPHTVTSDDGTTFDSGNVAVGGTFRFTFTTTGTYTYHCNIHPYMRATIIVV
jgi:plastocyanin